MRFGSAKSTHADIPSSLRPLVAGIEAIADGDLTVALDGGKHRGRSGDRCRCDASRRRPAQHPHRRLREQVRRSGTGWREVNDVAWAMLETSETTAGRASSAASTANEVSDSMHRIAAATEELAATIREVATHASLASSVASDVSGQVVAANQHRRRAAELRRARSRRSST